MLKDNVTKMEACRKWVKEFNAIPQNLIVLAYPDMEGIEILATERVCSECGGIDFSNGPLDEGFLLLICDRCQLVNEYNETYDFPMWSTMWTFDDSCDEDWAKENIETMRDCGFWIYESEDLGIFFGINGAGYDFYENHWLPLYDSRGLKWHTEKEGN